MHEWRPETVVDRALARRLIARFPEVELRSLELLAEGWDNTVWLADGRWVFRFPRRTIAVAGVAREMAFLPALAPRLPLPIPVPRFLGEPAGEFPWPYFGAALVPGREIADAPDGDRRAWARPLAEFLRALHAPAMLEGRGPLPVDPMGRADMRRRVPMALERLDDLRRLGLWRDPFPWLVDARDLPPAEATAVAHGDLHLRHVLIGDDRPCGVIDWGDLCRADPAIDLPLLYGVLPPAARAEFLAVYGPVRDDQLLRARVLAVFLCATLAVYAHHEGMPSLEREALAGLARAADG